ncbi:MAG: ribonuclease III [Spirochaetia bacterium]|nr:ribonuclease III [Spirochaetota bacterium]MDW8112243.1 ribonuclease III [Spirochaetia bacterium]
MIFEMHHNNISKERLEKLKELEEKLGVKFRDVKLLNKSLTHSSFTRNNSMSIEHSNERLEFIGDAVISLIISEYLYRNYPNLDEGGLSMIRADVVSRKSMYGIGIDLGLDKVILTYPPVNEFDERGLRTIISNSLEAVIGAIFISSGLEVTRQVVLRLFKDIIESRIKDGTKDYKSLLQTYSVSNLSTYPVYTVVEETGPEHRKEFVVRVFINNTLLAEGKGSSKKEAEQNAARNALEKIKKEENI